jgi:hypothetical protein
MVHQKAQNNQIGGDEPAVLVKAQTIAHRISVTGRYVLQLADAGKIPCVRIGAKCVRFDPHAVAAALGFQWAGGSR